MGSFGIEFAALLVGVPSTIIVMVLVRGWWAKSREFKLQERRIQMEERLRSDELSARILRSEEPGHALGQIAQMAEEIRALRQEVSELRQDILRSRGQ